MINRREVSVDKQKTERGQGTLELALILPVLLILMMGVAEIGFALRNYLVVVNAGREAGRFAARGRFGDEEIADRALNSGGMVHSDDGDVPFFRATGDDPNAGIIITRIPMDEDGETDQVSTWITGVVGLEEEGIRPILPDDSVISMTQITDRHQDTSITVNDMRESAGLDPLENQIVVVEVFYLHDTLILGSFVPLPKPLEMYTRSEMRMTRGKD